MKIRIYHMWPSATTLNNNLNEWSTYLIYFDTGHIIHKFFGYSKER